MSGLTSAATRFTNSEQEVQPPVNIGHIQWLDMHDWKGRHAAGASAWEQWYQANLAEIVQYPLDSFPAEHAKRAPNAGGSRHYNGPVCIRLACRNRRYAYV